MFAHAHVAARNHRSFSFGIGLAFFDRAAIGEGEDMNHFIEFRLPRVFNVEVPGKTRMERIIIKKGLRSSPP